MKRKHADLCTNDREIENANENEEKCNKNQSIQFDTKSSKKISTRYNQSPGWTVLLL